MPSTTRRRLLATLGTAATAGMAGCSAIGAVLPPNEQHPTTLGTPWTPPEGSWQYPTAGPRHTAQTPTTPPAEPTVVWRRPGGDAVDANHGTFVGVADGRVVVSAVLDGRARLRALALEDGTELWRNEVPLPEQGWFRPGGIVDGTVYATDSTRDLLAIDTADGSVVWRRSLRKQVADAVPGEYVPGPGDGREFGPVVTPTPHTLYVATGYGLHGVDADDGAELWRVFLGDEGGSLFRPRAVAVTTDGAHLTGLVSWSASVMRYGSPENEEIDVEHRRTDANFVGRPMTTDRHNVAFLNRGSLDEGALVTGVGPGGARWTFPGHIGDGSDTSAEFATDGNRVFLAETHGDGQVTVSALRVETGQIEWRFQRPPANWITGADYRLLQMAVPAVADDTLLVGYGGPNGETGTLLALSRTDGTLRWRRKLPAGPKRLAVVDDTLVVTDRYGGVTALRTDGNE